MVNKKPNMLIPINHRLEPIPLLPQKKGSIFGRSLAIPVSCMWYHAPVSALTFFPGKRGSGSLSNDSVTGSQ